MSEGEVRLECDGPVATLWFDRPAAHNALTWDMWRAIGRHGTALADDPTVRVVVLRGAGGKAFIAGTDIAGFADFADGARGVAYEAEMDGYVSAIETLSQPVVAVVEGWAVGGGLALSFAADFRIATPDAKFGAPLARTIGNCLSARGYARLARTAGVAMAKRMLLLAETVGAPELAALGLVNRVAEREELDVVLAEMVDRLIANAPITQAVSKEGLHRVAPPLPDIDDLIARTYASEDFREGVRAFLAKEKPRWTGR